MVTEVQFAEALVEGMGSFQRLAWRFARTSEDAEDMLQDGLLRAYEKRQEFRGEARLITWIYRVLLRTCLIHCRKAKVRRMVSLEDLPLEPMVGSQVARTILVKELLLMVPVKCRQELVAWMAGTADKDLARHFALSEVALKSRRFHALRRLRKQVLRENGKGEIK